MKPPKPSKNNQPNLLQELETTPDAKLEGGVIEAEGVNGSLVQPVYSTRKMRCYSITESELKQLSLVNSLTAFAWSVLSGISLFVVDVIKDFIMTPDVPDRAISFVWYTWPLLAFILIVAGLGVWKATRWRKSLMELIKAESKPQFTSSESF